MSTNPTLVHLHAKMYVFSTSTQCKPCNTPAHKCMDSMAIPMANLGTNMFTNPTVVQLHVKMHGFYVDNHIGELECMQNARENILQSSMYAKYAGNPRCRTFRPATA